MLDRRIVSKVIGVVTVFVAERDLVDALAELLAAIVASALGMAVVVEQRGKSAGQADPIVDLPQQQDAAIGRDVRRIRAEQERFTLELKLDR
jgi:hypothetical protein